MMEDGHADLARMRHRWKVGEGFVSASKYLKYYDVEKTSPNYIPAEHGNPDTSPKPFKKKLLRLFKYHNANRFKGRCIYIEDTPEDIYPNSISKHEDFLIIDSSVLDFTDQCLLISRDKWLNTFVTYVEKIRLPEHPMAFKLPKFV